MTDQNRYFVRIQKQVIAGQPAAILEAKAYAVSLDSDGTLTLTAEKQHRTFKRDMWDSFEVRNA